MRLLRHSVVASGLFLLALPFSIRGADILPQVDRGINFQSDSGRTPRIYSQQGASQQAAVDILSANWGVGAKPSVAKMSFDKKAIAAFENHFADDPEDPIKPEQIGDFKWVDIDKDGIYELLTTTAASRAFYNSLAIYKSVADKKILFQLIDVWMLSNLDEAVKDLDGDGTPELLLPMLLSEYRGTRPMAIWTAVYQWDGKRFVEASERFREFYHKRVLPELETQIQESSKPLPPNTTEVTLQVREEELAATWMIHDKIIRATGENPYAGVERARQWLKSPNENLRGNALRVFEDIPTGYFKAELQVLAGDPNPIVAQPAQHALERLKKQQP